MNTGHLRAAVEDVREAKFADLDKDLVEDVLNLHLKGGDDEALLASTRRLVQAWTSDSVADSDD